MMTIPQTARQALDLLMQDFPDIPDVQARIKGYIKALPEPTQEADLVQQDGLGTLLKAAREVMSWTEAAHRPPVRDELECGRSAGVRLHALADLREALLAFDQIPAPTPVTPSLTSTKVVSQVESAPAGAELVVDVAENKDFGLLEATYLWERMGYVGMDKVRQTLAAMEAKDDDEPGTVVINLEMPTGGNSPETQIQKDGL